jgi:hypothetical protein
MDPKFSNNGKKHRDKKHQRSERITTDLLDDEQLLMQNQHNSFGRFPSESLSTSSDQLNSNNSNSNNSNKKKWKCMQCTYENWPSALKCTLCLNSKNSSQTTYNNTTSSSMSSATTTTTTTGQHVKSNRNSLKKIHSLNSLKNNYNIFESTNNNNNHKNSNFNQIEITSLAHNQDSSCEEMTSVDANIGERPENEFSLFLN